MLLTSSAAGKAGKHTQGARAREADAGETVCGQQDHQFVSSCQAHICAGRSVSSKNKAAGAASRESSSLLAKATTEAGESAAAKKEAAAFRVASVALRCVGLPVSSTELRITALFHSKAARDDELSASVAENRSAQLRAYASSRLVASSSSAKLHMLMKSDGVIGNRMKDVQLLAHHSHALKNVLKEKPLRLTEMARQADRAARSA